MTGLRGKLAAIEQAVREAVNGDPSTLNEQIRELEVVNVMLGIFADALDQKAATPVVAQPVGNTTSQQQLPPPPVILKRRPTDEELEVRRVKLALAIKKDGPISTATAAFVTGLSYGTISQWLCGNKTFERIKDGVGGALWGLTKEAWAKYKELV